MTIEEWAKELSTSYLALRNAVANQDPEGAEEAAEAVVKASRAIVGLMKVRPGL